METTFELLRHTSGMEEKLIFEHLKTLENIWNISVNTNNSSVSFEYVTWADKDLVRKELHELGYRIVNETHRLDEPERLL